MAHSNALNDTPQTVQAGVPRARNPTTPGDLPDPLAADPAALAVAQLGMDTAHSVGLPG